MLPLSWVDLQGVRFLGSQNMEIDRNNIKFDKNVVKWTSIK